MTIIDEKTDRIEPCQCGFKPDHYSIGYGRTPYSIHCQSCRKSLHGGCDDRIFDLWNAHVRQSERRDIMYGIRYRDEEDCAFETPLVYETGLMGLWFKGEPLNGAALRR